MKIWLFCLIQWEDIFSISFRLSDATTHANGGHDAAWPTAAYEGVG